ncbi:MAG: hypothetical protein ABI112_11615 [Terracoccus sp.]
MITITGECRLQSTEFDIAASAGWYSAIAGLLAGFALLSILFPLDHETIRSSDNDDKANSDAVVTYTCAFFALLILAFTYAVLAGRTLEGPIEAVAAHEQLLAGSAFGLSTLLMPYGLHAVLKTYGANRGVFSSAQQVIVRMTSLYGPAASSRCSSAAPLTSSDFGPAGRRRSPVGRVASASGSGSTCSSWRSPLSLSCCSPPSVVDSPAAAGPRPWSPRQRSGGPSP